MNIKRGMRFEHKYWITYDLKSPAVFEVTRVAQGRVYYKMPGDKKARMFFYEDESEKSVGRWLDG